MTLDRRCLHQGPAVCRGPGCFGCQAEGPIASALGRWEPGLHQSVSIRAHPGTTVPCTTAPVRAIHTSLVSPGRSSIQDRRLRARAVPLAQGLAGLSSPPGRRVGMGAGKLMGCTSVSSGLSGCVVVLAARGGRWVCTGLPGSEHLNQAAAEEAQSGRLTALGTRPPSSAGTVDEWERCSAVSQRLEPCRSLVSHTL